MFHHPVQSVATYKLVLSRQAGASTDSPRPPLTSRPRPATPFSIAATRSSVPSQGICGWFQQIQASRRPSGDGVGNATKSVPVTSGRIAPGWSAADPSSGTATMARLTLPASCRSWTHQISVPSGESTKSA